MNDHAARVYDSILGLQSSEKNPTPLVRLHRVVPFQLAKVFAKLEWYNPFGSVKDRVGANLIAVAEADGSLQAGRKLVEPTSGNTGLALAMIGNAKGYALKATLSAAVPLEKRAMLRFFGADLVELDDTLCPAPGAPEGAIAKAMDTARDEPGFHMLNQYENRANPDAHYQTTGPEIWRQTQGKVTHFVAGMGTCGSITGTGRFLKEKNPAIQVVGVHPNEGHDIPGVRSLRQLKQTQFYRPQEYDRTVEVNDEEAFSLCLRLNREESIIAGPSSAMALAGMLKVLADQPDAVIVVLFPDNIFKYASSVQRHLPEYFAGMRQEAAPRADSGEDLLSTLIANMRNPRNTVEVDEVSQLLRGPKTPVIVDVRREDLYRKAHLPGAVNIPMEELKDRTSEAPRDFATPIVTVCNRGNISLSGALFLKSLGYHDVRSLNGGTTGWLERGLPSES